MRPGVLRSGLYAYVTLEIPRLHPDVVLPAETLIFDQSGPHVAVVGEGDRVKMVPVNIRRDFGTSLEVDQGPKSGEPVILSPPATLTDGVESEGRGRGQGREPAGGHRCSPLPSARLPLRPGGEGAGAVGGRQSSAAITLNPERSVADQAVVDPALASKASATSSEHLHGPDLDPEPGRVRWVAVR